MARRNENTFEENTNEVEEKDTTNLEQSSNTVNNADYVDNHLSVSGVVDVEEEDMGESLTTLVLNQIKRKSDGKIYNNYVVKSKIRGRDFEIVFNVDDQSSRILLDEIVFFETNVATLEVVPSFYNDSKGKKHYTTKYIAVNVDEGGKRYLCPVKPFGSGNKQAIKTYLAELGFEVA